MTEIRSAEMVGLGEGSASSMKTAKMNAVGGRTSTSTSTSAEEKRGACWIRRK